MSQALFDKIESEQFRKDSANFAVGDTVRVHTKVVEGDKERIQVFQGVVVKQTSGGTGPSFTVRRVTYGVGVERTFPANAPRVEKVEVLRRGRTRRAKLYYLRDLSAKSARLKERRLTPQELEAEQEEASRPRLAPETAETGTNTTE